MAAEAPPDRQAKTWLGRWWYGDFGRRLVAEGLILLGLLLLYRTGRLLISGHVTEATSHARDVLAVEQWLHIDTEAGLQHVLVPNRWLIHGLNEYYVHVHLIATAVWLIGIYGWRREFFARARWVLISVTGAALLIHVAFPLAPPRMLPGFVDTVARYGPTYYSRGDVASVANQFAAMPSLHFGWALIVAWGIVHAFRSPWRYLAVLHPVATLLAITATANHFWMDSIVATVLVATAIALTSPKAVERARRRAARHRDQRATARSRSGTARLPHAA